MFGLHLIPDLNPVQVSRLTTVCQMFLDYAGIKLTFSEYREGELIVSLEDHAQRFSEEDLIKRAQNALSGNLPSNYVIRYQVNSIV